MNTVMNTVEPPKSDDSIERHQFYTKVASRVELNTKDINGIGKKIAGVGNDFEVVKINVHTFSTKAKTIVSICGFLFTIAQGVGAWYLEKASAAVDKAQARLEAVEKKLALVENDTILVKNIPNDLTRLKSIHTNLQNQIDGINEKLLLLVKKK